MERINFTNGKAPALNGANLNQLQTNIENAIQDAVIEKTQADLVNESEPVKCGYKIDGKEVYKKIITTNGGMNGVEQLVVPHGITNYEAIWIDLSDSCIRTTDGAWSYPFPMVGYNGTFVDKTYCYLTDKDIVVCSNGGWGTIWIKQIAIKFTKAD
jgi:hypothetical protein